MKMALLTDKSMLDVKNIDVFLAPRGAIVHMKSGYFISSINALKNSANENSISESKKWYESVAKNSEFLHGSREKNKRFTAVPEDNYFYGKVESLDDVGNGEILFMGKDFNKVLSKLFKEAPILKSLPHLPNFSEEKIKFRKVAVKKAIKDQWNVDAQSAPALYEAEIRSAEVLSKMEDKGIKVDNRIHKYSEDEQKVQEDLKSEIKRLSGISDPGNASEVAKYVYEIKKLAPYKTSKSGRVSCTKDVLLSVQDKDPIIKLVLEYQERRHNLSVIENIISNEEDGRIHTSFDQLSCSTGRIYSGGGTNLQGLSKEVMQFLIPDDSYYLLNCDVKSEELCIMSALSGDTLYSDSIRNGEDMHKKVASLMFGIPVEQVTPEQRKQAKVLSFALNYGANEYSIALTNGISEAEAVDLINRYYQAVPGVKKYKEEIIRQTRQTGIIKTPFGRECKVEYTGDPYTDAKIDRNALNSPLQGTGADYLKMALAKVQKGSLKEIEAEVLLVVHDSFVLQVPKKIPYEKAKEVIKRELECHIPAGKYGFKADLDLYLDISEPLTKYEK